jgi:hypothetical protein
LVILEDIQDGQRLLKLAGRDPVEVLKGLEEDEDFKLTTAQVKTLGEALGWPLVFSDSAAGPSSLTKEEEVIGDSSPSPVSLSFYSFLFLSSYFEDLGTHPSSFGRC